MLRKLLIISTLLLGYTAKSQTLIQTYTDRCTGATQVFTVPFNGGTVITFYDQSRSFTADDFKNGTLQSWLEGVYLSWRSLNPCSQTQAENNVLQTTVQETAKAATEAATQAATQVPIIPQSNEIPITPDTPSTPAVEVQTSTPEPVTTVDSTQEPVVTTESPESGPTGAETPSDTNNEPTTTTESTEAEATPVESSDSQEDSSTPSESSDETTSEDSGGDSGDGETSEESSESESVEEESSEEEATEESSEEESSEEESETTEETEEESEEGGKKKKKKKKRNTAPPIIVANISSMQNVDGTFQQAMTMGVSKSSLRGDQSYGATAMVWSNLKQFMLMGNYSKVFFKEGKPYMVYSFGLGASKMFTTVVGMTNHSLVFLGNKGLVVGTSLGLTSIFLNYDYYDSKIDFDDNILSSNITAFFTKPYLYSDRLTISPMVAASKPLTNRSLYQEQTGVSPHVMFITGANFDYLLTKRFKVNIGTNAINNTDREIPTTFTITIGSRFSF